jgi:hypothetical protein
MTLFVDSSDSDFFPCKTGNCQEKNIFKTDFEAFAENFKDSNFSAAAFKNLPEIGNGLILLKSSNNSHKTIVHIRCTSQNAKSPCLLLKLDISFGHSLLASNKNKAKRVLEALGVNFDGTAIIKSISSSKIRKNIQKMDAELNLNRFKFGIAYLDRFDTSEDQMLANTLEDSSTSAAFSNFLQGLGDEICLKGFKGFSGGLDVSEEALTGTRAVYNKGDDLEVIYHIAPWLPQTESQLNLERKRHFGNDTIVLIFSESLYAFELNTLLSRQIQVVLFVRFINRLQKYQIHVYSKLADLVLESNPVYIERTDDFKKLSKLLIYLERQCYNTHPLVDKLYCMRNFHLNQIISKLM